MEEQILKQLAQPLLAWYDIHRRILPWREEVSPYRPWVSEIMLQQTRVAAVLPYFQRFMEAFPTVEALAQADTERLMKLWEGLGYYSRARNLQKAARILTEQYGGRFPETYRELTALPGIGDYTAGAILSIAFGQAVPAVDGNVIRVASRVMGIRENVGIPSVRRELEEKVDSLVPAARPGDFNQALMDLGAAICVPGTPNCDVCPLRAHCDAYDAGDAEDLPVLPQKNPPKPFDWDVLLIFSGEKVLMRQRTETMLHGLWVFPMLPGHSEHPAELGAQLHLAVRNVRPAGDAKHVFTHQIWRMKLYQMDAPDADAPKGYRFVTLDEMNALTIPTAMKAAGKVARARLEENPKFGIRNAE